MVTSSAFDQAGRDGTRDFDVNAAVPAERRIISILAVDVVGSTRHIAHCDPEDAQAFFDRCFDHIRSAIETAGGTLVSYEGDGGIATFGWPIALEQHADHACDAAWAIQRDNSLGTGPAGEMVQFRIGVHTGLVAVRPLRGGGRSRLDTVGVAVHVAAKLQQAVAPGGVLVSDDAVRMCHRRPYLGDRVRLSGFDQANVEAWSLKGPGKPPSHAGFAARYLSPMIGRQAEYAKLTSLLPNCGGGSVALVGEPGVGKSRLAAELVATAATADIRVLMLFGDAQRRSAAFALARALLDDRSLDDDIGLSAHERRALSAAGLEAAEIDAVDALLMPQRLRAHRQMLRLTDTQLARLLVRTVVTLVLDRPALIVVEDMHLVDPESRLFLHLLGAAETVCAFTLLVTTRPESRDAARQICSSVIALEPLPQSTMRTLVELLWTDGCLPSEAMIERIVDRADGIPLVLEEVVRSAAAGGNTVTALPQAIGSLIHARLTQLSPGARRLAQALSILSDDMHIEFGSEMLGIELAEVRDQLGELEQFALVHPLDGHLMQIRHQVIAEACAETIPRQERRGLHRAAHRVIAASSRTVNGRDMQLAHHAEGAGDLPLALDHLWRIALDARRSSATTSLALTFDRAIAMVSALGDAADEKYADFVLMAFAAMIQRGESAKMSRHLPRVIELVRKGGQPERISSALSQLGMLCWFDGRYAEGLRATQEGLAIARKLGSPTLIYANMIMQTNLRQCLGQVHQAIAEQHELCALLTGELEVARLGSPGLPSATALSFMGWFMVETGDYEDGLTYVERGLAIAIRERDRYGEVLARNCIGRILTALGRNEEAVACQTLAREIAAYNGYDAIRADIDGRAAIALARSGRPAEALDLAEACLKDGMHLRTGQHEFYYLLIGKAEALLGLGRCDAALETLDEALGLARRAQNPCLISDALGLRAAYFIYLQRNSPQAAADLAEQGEICAVFGLIPWRGWRATAPGLLEPAQPVGSTPAT